MNIDHTMAKRPEKQDDALRTGPPFFPDSVQRDITCMTALIEATRERRLAAFKISELTRQAVDSLLHLGKTTK